MSDNKYVDQFNVPGDYAVLAGEHLEIAKYRFKKRQHDGAEEAFTQAINIFAAGMERFPKAPLLYLQCGQALVLAKKIIGTDMRDAAEQAFDKGLKVEPRNVPLLRSKARLKMECGFFEESEALFFDAINVGLEKPESNIDVRVLESLADMYCMWKKPIFMSGCLWKSKQIEPGNMFLLKREYDLLEQDRRQMTARSWSHVMERIHSRRSSQQDAALEQRR